MPFDILGSITVNFVEQWCEETRQFLSKPAIYKKSGNVGDKEVLGLWPITVDLKAGYVEFSYDCAVNNNHLMMNFTYRGRQ